MQALWSLGVLVGLLSYVYPSPNHLLTDQSILSKITHYETENDYVVPDIVHQVYDYQSPNLLLYLSILSIQYFHHPKRHILWVNDEGKYRKSHWEGWQRNKQIGSWEEHFYQLIHVNKSLEIQFITFPSTPPGNTSIYVSNKAHKSDFVRMEVLKKYGGIYIDTDAIVSSNLNELRKFPFVLSFDNIVNKENSNLPTRLNNGVIFSAKDALFLSLWMKKYSTFHVEDFSYDSSVVPWKLTLQYPDLIHIEMNRISPVSYGFHTAKLAEALTCGIYVPPSLLQENHYSLLNNSIPKTVFDEVRKDGAVWYPDYNYEKKQFSYENTIPDSFMFSEGLKKKLIIHLTMSQVR
jgi:hypothetical protein